MREDERKPDKKMRCDEIKRRLNEKNKNRTEET